MTREEAKQLLPVIQAWADGRAIQVNTGSEWRDLNSHPGFNEGPKNYRIKPEPREFWVNIYPLESRTRAHTYTSKEEADVAAGHHREECIRVREVLD